MNYVAFDIETTGLNPKYEKIIEIGAVRVREGELTDTFSTFVNPAKSLPEQIVELTGIHDADVADAPYIDEILDEFLAFVGEDVLLGHNILFDYSFVKKAAVNQRKPFEKLGIDTLRIAKRFLNDLESRQLGFLCDYYHIALDAHRALNDAVAAHRLYRILAREFGGMDCELFLPKPLVYTVKKESPATSKQLELIMKLIIQYQLPCVGTILGPIANVTDEAVDLNKVTKNEASRLIDKLLASVRRSRPS